MKRIGIFGGSFNPITNGHMEMIRQAIGFFDAIEVMPAFYHADKPNLESFRHRFAMVSLAIYSEKLHLQGVNPSMFEFALKECQTSRIVQHYVEVNKAPDLEFYFIIGEDAMESFDSWEESETMKAIVNFYVFKRPPADSHEFLRLGRSKHLDDKWFAKGKNRVLEAVPSFRKSSTKVREWIKQGYDFSRVVPPSVYEYIRMHKLYA